MTRARTILIAIVAAGLIAALVMQSVRLAQCRRELTRYRESDQLRRESCLFYKATIGVVENWIKGAQTDAVALHKPANQVPGHVFFWLTRLPFLELCRVAEPMQSKILNEHCLRHTPDGLTEYDFACLEALAKELQPALSLE